MSDIGIFRQLELGQAVINADHSIDLHRRSVTRRYLVLPLLNRVEACLVKPRDTLNKERFKK